MLDIEIIKSSTRDKGFISSVYYFDEIDSTNSFASKNDIPVDSLVISEYQSAGKGRLGRNWNSEKYSGLTFTIKKKLPLSPVESQNAVFYFSYYLFKAIQETLFNYLPKTETRKLQIKWPNDILFERKKISGILIESKLPDGIFIIGIGINCNQTQFPDDLNAISLRQIISKELNLTELLIQIINEFSANFNKLLNSDFKEIYNIWKNSTNIIGKMCNFSIASGNVNYGKITDLNEDGSISIEIDKVVEKYYSGDIKLTGFNYPEMPHTT